MAAISSLGYCQYHQDCYSRRLERNRINRKDTRMKKRAKVEEKEVMEVTPTTQETSHEQIQTLQHRHIQRDIQFDRVTREFHADGSKASEVLEHTRTREEEDSRSYEAKIVDRHKSEISQEIRQKMTQAAELVQFDKLYLFKKHGRWFDTNIVPKIPKVAQLNASQLVQFVDPRLMANDGIRYFEDDFGPIMALINHMLFEQVPPEQLPELTAIYTFPDDASGQIVWTNWNFPGGRYHSIQISCVQVPLLALQRYENKSQTISKQLQEYLANEIANEEATYDERKYKLDRFAMVVKGCIRES